MDNWALQTLLNMAHNNHLRVTSTTGGQHNTGSLHYLHRAIDVDPMGMTPQFVGMLRNGGFRVLDERQRLPGEKVWGGPHFHIEIPMAFNQGNFRGLLGGPQVAQAPVNPGPTPAPKPSAPRNNPSNEMQNVVSLIDGMPMQSFHGLLSPQMLAMSNSVNPDALTGTGNQYRKPNREVVPYDNNVPGVLNIGPRYLNPDQQFQLQHQQYQQMLQDMMKQNSPISPFAGGVLG